MSSVDPRIVIFNTGASPQVAANGAYPYSSAGIRRQGPASDCFRNEQPKPKQSFFGKVKDFVTGMASAALGIFSVKGILMAAGCVLLGAVMPWTIPLMVGATLVSGTVDLVKALSSGDYKAAGENTFGILASVFGARNFAPKAGAAAENPGLLSNIWSGDWAGVSRQMQATGRRCRDGLLNIPSRSKAQFLDSAKATRWSEVRWNALKNDAKTNVRNYKDGGILKTSWRIVKGFMMGDMPATAIQVDIGAHEHHNQWLNGGDSFRR